MHATIPMSCGLLFTGAMHAQPYIDLFTVNHLSAPGHLERTEISATLPLKLDSNGRLLLFDPQYVRWCTTTAADLYALEPERPVEERMGGVVLPVTYVTPLSASWKLAVGAIGRYNHLHTPATGAMQPAGFALASRSVRKGLTLRFGVYASDELFGLFVRPLLGIDWRIDAKSSLFGVLPGSLSYQHRSSARFRWGACFRAYTNSYGTRDGAYRRIDENPLGLFGEVYFSRNIVLRLEAGYSFVRQVRGGPLDPIALQGGTLVQGYVDHGIDDSVYFRLLLAYRLRLDEDRAAR